MSHHRSREQMLSHVLTLLVDKVLEMALDLSRLTAEVERSNTVAAALLSSHSAATDPALQAAVDALTAKLASASTSVESALAPPGTTLVA